MLKDLKNCIHRKDAENAEELFFHLVKRKINSAFSAPRAQRAVKPHSRQKAAIK
jgi:hypothetical protein